MASLRDIVEDLAQGDESELLVMSFDIGTTQCESPGKVPPIATKSTSSSFCVIF